MVDVEVEDWKGEKYIVARDKKGRIQTKVKQEKSDYTVAQLRNIFKEKGTFREERQKRITKLTNVTEVEITREMKPSEKSMETKPLRTPPDRHDTRQYIVRGYWNKEEVVGRSKKIGTEFVKDSGEAKEQAWNNFLRKLSVTAGLGSDIDEGLTQLDKVDGLREGWVYYRSN